ITQPGAPAAISQSCRRPRLAGSPGPGISATPRRWLLQVTHVVDSYHLLRRIPYGLVPGDVGLAENVHLSIERFAFPDGLDGLAFRIQNGSDRARTIVLFHVGGDADILVTMLHEDRSRTLSLIHDLIN